MFITKYAPKTDNWTLMRVMKKRDLNPKEVHDFPKLGFLVFEEDKFIGAGFLRKCEGNVGIFDSYLTDPSLPPKLRDQALEMITKNLVHTAKSIGINRLLAFSVDDNTIVRSQRHGFALTNHKVLGQVL